MKRVTGVGGVFFKCKDPKAMREWYGKHLGFRTDDYGTNFESRDIDDPDRRRSLLWAPFDHATEYFLPSEKPFMINFRVENLEALLEILRQEGVKVVDAIETFPYGKFAHVMDPEGNKIELWEPNDDEYEKMIEDAHTP